MWKYFEANEPQMQTLLIEPSCIILVWEFDLLQTQPSDQILFIDVETI